MKEPYFIGNKSFLFPFPSHYKLVPLHHFSNYGKQVSKVYNPFARRAVLVAVRKQINVFWRNKSQP